MQYQNYFMMIKKYDTKNGKFVATNLYDSFGFVQIKISYSSSTVSVQLSGGQNCKCYCVQNSYVNSFLTKNGNGQITLDYAVDPQIFCLLIPSQKLYSTKNSTICAQSALDKIGNNSASFCAKNYLEKIFGKTIPNTYFFDSIKGKLAQVFAVGQKNTELEEKYPLSKWTELSFAGEKKIVGVVYKNDFAYAIGFGKINASNNYDQKYSIMFLSAEQGNIINL